jgi:hypothetical protein
MAKKLSDAIKAAFKRTLPVSQDENIDSRSEHQNEVQNKKSKPSDSPIDASPSPISSAPSSPQPGPSREINRPRTRQTTRLESNPDGNLFLQKTPLYENDHIKVYVVKDYLKRQKVFKLDDHLYSVKVEVKDGHPPLLTSLLDILRKAFEFMIKSLQKFYHANDKNIMYMTIYQDSMQSALNSGGFELHGNQPENMVNYSLNMLNRFLNSNATLKLDNSFCVYFKVLSVQHVNYAFHRRGPLMIVGCEGQSNTPGTLEIDTEGATELMNKCLLTHIILGKLLCEARGATNHHQLALLLSLCKQKKRSYQKHYFTKKKRSPISEERIVQARKRGLFLLKSKVQKLISDCDLPLMGPYDVHEVLPKICEVLDIQVQIICGLQTKNASLLSFPPTFDNSKIQIVLEKLYDHHVTLISNLKSFFGFHKKRVCFECSKTFHHSYRHFCTKKKICFACRRFFSSKDTEIRNDRFFEYCDGEIEEKFLPVPSECTTCNFVSITKNCQDMHKKLCAVGKNSKGRLGYFCNVCQKHFRQGFSCSEDAQLNHICDPTTTKCYTCKLPKKEKHQCPIKKELPTKEIPILAFFAFSFKALEHCKNCLLKQQEFKENFNLTWSELYQHSQFGDLVCDSHGSMTNAIVEPNVAVIFKEVSRGEFEKIVLTEDELQLDTIAEKGLSNDYLPTNVEQTNFQLKSQYYHNVDGMLKSLDQLKYKNKKSLVEKFLLLVTQPQWQNTTFLSLNANNCTNLAVLKGFIAIDVMPYVIENGHKVNLISIDFLKLRFLNASAYIAGTLEEIHDQYGLDENLHYFPDL